MSTLFLSRPIVASWQLTGLAHVEHRPAKRKRDEGVQPSFASHRNMVWLIIVDSDGQRIVYSNIAMQLLSGSQASRPMTAQHGVDQGTNSFLPERSTAVSSPTLQQKSSRSYPRLSPLRQLNLSGLMDYKVALTTRANMTMFWSATRTTPILRAIIKWQMNDHRRVLGWHHS